MTQVGLKITDWIDTTNWRPIHPFDFRMESHAACPTDGTPFTVIAAIVSLSTDERIRVGCCPKCGLVGYIDRPSEADIDRYYAETWMGETVEQATAKARAIRPANIPTYQTDTACGNVALEIGCGYGGMAKALLMHGYEVHATESCPARAEAVRSVHGIQVTRNMPNQKYGLIVSNHVLEHVVNPFKLLAECAARQDDGGLLAFTMPAFSAEPSMGVLMFLPHLWSFTAGSLAVALYAAGYSVQSMGQRGMELQVVARRGTADKATITTIKPEGAIAKFLRGLGLSVPSPAVLTWQRDFEGSTLTSEFYAASERDHAFPRRVKVEAVERFVSDAPLEIQFDGRVQLCIK